MYDLDSRLLGNLGPDVPGAPCSCPVIAGFLAGHRDVAEIADRRPDRFGVAFDDCDRLSFSGGGKRNRQANYSRPDDHKVITLAHNLSLPLKP
ncbi:hypothetical protein D3C80_1314010 [compost metagenome]